MKYSITISGKTVQVSMTSAASQILAQTDIAVVVEMELLFSCLIRKRVKFRHESRPAVGEWVTDRRYVHFRPVMTQACSITQGADGPSLTTFPIVNEAAYVPKWLRINYRRGEWLGEFGY